MSNESEPSVIGYFAECKLDHKTIQMFVSTAETVAEFYKISFDFEILEFKAGSTKKLGSFKTKKGKYEVNMDDNVSMQKTIRTLSSDYSSGDEVEVFLKPITDTEKWQILRD